MAVDHVSLPVADLERAATFYDAVLATLGLRRRKERPGAIGYGDDTRAAAVFCVRAGPEKGPSAGPGLHVSFTAPDRASVDSFHAVALRAGGTDAGPPGL